MKRKEEISFERSIDRLEAIVDALGNDDLSLARALELFQEGIAQLRVARGELERAEAQVKLLVEQADGSFSLVDHDA